MKRRRFHGWMNSAPALLHLLRYTLFLQLPHRLRHSSLSLPLSLSALQALSAIPNCHKLCFSVVDLQVGMVGIRWPASEAEAQSQAAGSSSAEGVNLNRLVDDPLAHFSDDDRSVAADSWSVKSEYGSLMDGDDVLRNADAAEALAVANLPPPDYSSDKEQDEIEPSVLGLQSHWDSTYADELSNFHEHGDTGEIWFGEEVMDIIADWVARLCSTISAGLPIDPVHGMTKEARCKHSDVTAKSSEGVELAGWNVLDIGTGNGLFLHALAKQGFTDLTGVDYSDSAVVLAKEVAEREGLGSSVTFLVDDVLETKLQKQYKLVTDKGTFDAIGLHPEGQQRRCMYWKAVSNLVALGGLLVITSCNNTKDELVDELSRYEQSLKDEELTSSEERDVFPNAAQGSSFQYLDHIRTYPIYQFGGMEGSRVCTVAFIHKS